MTKSGEKTAGFSLVEILVTLTIVGMIALAVTAVTPLNARDQQAYEATTLLMDRIATALLGVRPTHLVGERRYLGYIADMGGLPELLGDHRQPAGLWTDRLADGYGAAADLPTWAYAGNEIRLWSGWRGPYLEAPIGLLRDGWGRPLVFERFVVMDDGSESVEPAGPNLRFLSPGADGVRQDDGVEINGYDHDLVRVILVGDYLGSVAGYAPTEAMGIAIYFPVAGKIASRTLSLEKDGYFFSGATESDLLPIGTRGLHVLRETSTSAQVVFSLEPTANFTGLLR